MSQRPLLFTTVFISAFLMPSTTLARLNTLTAGIVTGVDYSETNYDKDETDDKTVVGSANSRSKKLSVGPILILESSSSIDRLTINYRPDYTCDLEGSTSDTDHNLSVSGYRKLSKELRFDLSEKFIYSDDPDLVTDANSSDYNKGRKRYWTNNFNLKSTYTYNTESFLGGGYTYRILRNDDTGIGGYEDYDKHTANFFLTHQFNSSWNIDSSFSYTLGLFDPPDQEVVDTIEAGLETVAEGSTAVIDSDNLSNDLSEYRANAIVNWFFTSAGTLQIKYSFSASNYDAILRNDSILHNFSLGAQYQHSKRLSFNIGGGPSYEKTDTYDANWNYNAYFTFKYSISKRTSFSASAEKGYEQNNFSTNNNQYGRDQGLTEFTDWKLDFSHKLLKNLDLTLYTSYRNERQENIVHGIVTVINEETDLRETDREDQRELTIFERDIYRAGASFKYSFMQYWKAALHYNFRRQNSERINDSYDENRAYVTLSVQNEIFRW